MGQAQVIICLTKSIFLIPSTMVIVGPLIDASMEHADGKTNFFPCHRLLVKSLYECFIRKQMSDLLGLRMKLILTDFFFKLTYSLQYFTYISESYFHTQGTFEFRATLYA